MKELYNNPMTNAVIYSRVSTDEQVEGFSLDFQEKICKDFAEKHSYHLLRTFREEGHLLKLWQVGNN